MKFLTAIVILLAYSQAAAAVSLMQAYPSCDIEQQNSVKVKTGGSKTDLHASHISLRINVLQADISTARKARRLTQSQADMLWQHANRIRNDAARYVKKQGFLSAAERASYDREFDEIATKLCMKLTVGKS